MAAVVTGSKTVTKDVGPTYTAAQLTAILAIPIESLTIAQLRILDEAVRKVASGHEPKATVGSLFP